VNLAFEIGGIRPASTVTVVNLTPGGGFRLGLLLGESRHDHELVSQSSVQRPRVPLLDAHWAQPFNPISSGLIAVGNIPDIAHQQTHSDSSNSNEKTSRQRRQQVGEKSLSAGHRGIL